MRAHTHCPVPGDTMTELDPARGQRAHFFGEGSGNQALLHKHSDFNNTTEHICTTTTLISPFLLGDSLSEGGKKKCWLCLSLFWVCPKPMWSVVSYWFCAGGLLNSVEFGGYMHLFILHFRCFIFACIISSSWGKSNYKISSLSIIGRAWRKPFFFYFITLNKICSPQISEEASGSPFKQM